MQTVDQLLNALAQGDYFERSNAARALGKTADPRVTEALVGALQDEDDWVVESAAETLGQLGDPAALEGLTGLLDHGGYKIRTAAASALGALGLTEALPALEAQADDRDSWVREAVRDAIDDIKTGKPASRRVTVISSMRPVTPRPTPTASSAIDPPALVLAAAERANAQHKALSDGSWLLRLTLSNGRHQKVRVITKEMTSQGEPRFRMLTVLAPATDKLVTWAMRQNIRISRGALGLLRLRKRDHLVLTETLMFHDATVDSLQEAIERLARRGDRLEQALTEDDIW